ncbi:MAG: ParB/RepB/Spo0J family partition protein [Bacteroidia bacterium]
MSEQLSLPYEVIEKVVGRQYLRENFTVGKTSYKIPVSKIKVRDNFNRRSEYNGIEELAGLIKEHGLQEPLIVDVLPDGTVYVEKGHRRLKAIQMLNDQGTGIETVECFVNSSNVTELQRALNIYVSNMSGHKLSTLDQAETVKIVKNSFGLSNEQIAAKIGVSRQTVDNLITISEMNDGLKHDIRHGEMSITSALALIRDQKKLQKQTDKAEELSHITGDGPTPLPIDPLKQEVEELKQLDIQAEQQQQQAAEFERKEVDRLERDAVLVVVGMESLESHFGKRLAAPARKHWEEDFVNEESGEVVTLPSSEIIMNQGVVISETSAQNLIDAEIPEVWIFREITTSASVITELPSTGEKSTFDEDRPEIASINNAIKLGDRILTQIEKADLPAGLKKDITDWSAWQMKSMLEAREYIHKNKKQNKRDR